MSKLDIHVAFDRPDRTYRGGDEITGTVTVLANADVSCNSLWIDYAWRTHGRGNRDRGPVMRTTLAQGNWQAGKSETYPFRFVAPDGPPTYRGHHLNIDHYVQARADIPWALDPKAEEEFILLPGHSHDDIPVPKIDEKDETRISGLAAKIGVGGSIALIVIGFTCLFPFGLIMVPLGLILLFVSLRNIIAEKKLGLVTLAWGTRRAPAGGTIPLAIAFTPRTTIQLNEITATLKGQEVCVSGSGTNKTTHKHELTRKVHRLCGPREFLPQEAVRLQFDVPIPETAAYSFDTPHNDIRWEIAICVDIPKWPDWTQNSPIIVLPSTTAPGGEPEAPPIAAVRQELVQSLIPLATRADAEAGTPEALSIEPPDEPPPAIRLEDDAPPAPAPVPEDVVASTIPDGSLHEVLERIGAAKRFGDDRQKIVEEYGDRVFPCDIDVESVTRSYGHEFGDDYRNGRSAVGRLSGTEHRIFVVFRNSSNAALDAVQPGEQHHADCMLVGWDRLYDRLKLREA